MAYGLKDHRLAVAQAGLTSFVSLQSTVAVGGAFETLTMFTVPTGYAYKVTTVNATNATAPFRWILTARVSGVSIEIYRQRQWQPQDDDNTWQGELWLTEGDILWVRIWGNAGNSLVAAANGSVYEAF